MIHETFSMKQTGSQDYARLITYIHDPAEEIGVTKRPLVLVCPGGAYVYTSAREAEPIALQFASMGYHSAVLHYSVAPGATYPVALTEVAASVKLFREHAEEWHIDPEKILVLGFSAGGHLAASYGCFWKEDFVAKEVGAADPEVLRPNGMILGYPVITSGEFAHQGSIENLLGDRYEELKEKMSLEKQVNADFPPTFLWHTFADGSVPVENSLLLVSALRKAGIPTEFHMYPDGGHGLSLCNEITTSVWGKEFQPQAETWIGLVRNWLKYHYPLTTEFRDDFPW